MTYQQHDLKQGTLDWAAFRATHFGASEAAAMLGLSPYATRNDLLKLKSTGLVPEVDAATQRIFDRGHETEIGGRSMAEDLIDDDLYPVVVSSGRLSASCDGLTMDESIAFEHKQWSVKLADSLRAGILPEHHQPQAQQVMMLTRAPRLLFMCSDGTPENCVHLWVDSDPEWHDRLRNGWQQFGEDLANYQHIEHAPAIVVAPIDDLPALTVELVGQVTSSNLALFKSAALARIESINTDLQTDEDFAVAKKTVKFLDDGEKRLVLVKQQALSQTASIDELFRTMDALREEMKAKRITLDKLVTAREASIKIEIMQAGKDALAVHIATLNKRLATVQMPPIVADFATAIKGKRNLESMRGAVDDLVAAHKIAANAQADKMQISLAMLDAETEHKFLFHDSSALVMKESDDLALIIRSRIADHKSAEEKRLAEEREKMRKEEEAKAEAKIKAEQAESQRKAAAEAAAKIEADRKEFAAPPKQPENVTEQSETQKVTRDQLLTYLENIVRGLTTNELGKLIAHADHMILNREEAA